MFVSRLIGRVPLKPGGFKQLCHVKQVSAGCAILSQHQEIKISAFHGFILKVADAECFWDLYQVKQRTGRL